MKEYMWMAYIEIMDKLDDKHENELWESNLVVI